MTEPIATLSKILLSRECLDLMNRNYLEENPPTRGIIPKDEIDEFFACKKCGMVGCDCEFELEERQ